MHTHTPVTYYRTTQLSLRFNESVERCLSALLTIMLNWKIGCFFFHPRASLFSAVDDLFVNANTTNIMSTALRLNA